MKRYFIRPVPRDGRSEAWAETIEMARSIKAHLQTVTGRRWRITKKEIPDDNPV